MVPGGRACVNVANLGRKPYIPLHAYIARDMVDLGFLMRGEIIWNGQKQLQVAPLQLLLYETENCVQDL